MSTIDIDRYTLQLTKFNEILQYVILKTEKIVTGLIETEPSLRDMYKDIPKLLDNALNIVQANSALSGSAKIKFLELPLKFFMKACLNAYEHGIDIFKMIYDKDERILTEHLNVIFPQDEYVDKIQYIYGANPERRNYVSPSDIASIWKLIKAAMERAIKWVIFSNNEKYLSRMPADLPTKYKINMDN